MKLTKYNLEIAIFACGAIVMIFELVGSRILGPYFGTSIFVWTSLIGIILGSLSLGYYLGGKLADKKPNINTLSIIILLAALFIGLTIFQKDILLIFLQNNIKDVKTSAVIASLILFLPPSLLLGIVSPYAAKLKLNNLNSSGVTIGNLYAISTAGSIFGTFFSGFYLIPHFGTNKLLMILSLSLIIISIILSSKNLIKTKLTIFIIIFLNLSTLSLTSNNNNQKRLFLDTDTSYNRVWISDNQAGNKRTLSINNEHSSAMFLNSEELVYEYTKYYHLARHFKPDFKETLMLGGAGYSYPKDFLSKYPEAKIDVVEIDPQVTELAKQYFNLKENPNLKIYHEDGRVYLNKTNKKYDVIFGDAFSSHFSIPYQLTTKEAVQKKYNILNDEGIVILNIISSINGEQGKFLRAEYATYQNVFPQVYLFPVRNSHNDKEVQNIILVALKSDKKIKLESTDEEIQKYLTHLWIGKIEESMPVLTDDFAPVDYYISKTI